MVSFNLTRVAQLHVTGLSDHELLLENGTIQRASPPLWIGINGKYDCCQIVERALSFVGTR